MKILTANIVFSFFATSSVVVVTLLAARVAVVNADDDAADSSPLAAAGRGWWWDRGGSCLDVSTVENFDLTTYASKTWYVQQQAANFYTPRDYDKCAKAEYKIRDSPTYPWKYKIDVFNSAERADDNNLWWYGLDRGGNLCADSDKNTPSQLKVAPCWLPKLWAGPYWIIDYNEDEMNGYALVSAGQPKNIVSGDTTCGDSGNEQCCKTGSGINNSGLWILTSQPNPSEELVEEVRGIARQKGFSTTSEVLFDVEQTDCGYDDIPATAIANGNFQTLVAALTKADLVATLSQPNGDYTVFAPTDSAFEELPTGLVDCLLSDIPTLKKILLYHVANGEVLAAQLTNGQAITTLETKTVIVDVSDDGSVIKINDSVVTIADVRTSNGVIHAIKKVLIPLDVDVDDYLATCTAPKPLPPCEDDPDQFQWQNRKMKACKWAKKMLKKKGIEFCDRSISTRNDNIHIKDLCPVTCRTCILDIPGTAIANGSFDTLVAALKAADLVDALSESGPFTVFAPVDSAFVALPDGLVGCLLKEKYKDVLTDILLYHVAAGKVLSSELIDGQQIATLETQNVVVDISDDGAVIKINNSTVIIPDVDASNGVIHAIDQVLVPPGVNFTAFLEVCTLEDIPTTAANKDDFKTLVTALSATGLVDALAEPNGPFTVFAPTDEAFADLPELVNCLLNDTPKLSEILKYHVAEGTVLLSELIDGQEITTLETQSVVVDLSDGVKINLSKVIIPDVATTNGVIHVINQVLVPPGMNITEYLETCDSTPPLPPPCEDDPVKFEWREGKMKACKWVQGQLNKRGINFCNHWIGNNDNKLHVKDVCPVTCGICVFV